MVIEAVQWTGDNIDEIQNFCHNSRWSIIGGELTIHTLEGNMEASIKDYIIKGVRGECYPCKPDIFK